MVVAATVKMIMMPGTSIHWTFMQRMRARHCAVLCGSELLGSS